MTTDVAYGSRSPRGAPEIKKKYGSAMQAMVPREECFVVPVWGRVRPARTDPPGIW